MTEQRRTTDFVTQRELFDALNTLTKEEREDRHDQRNQTMAALASLDTNMDLRLRAVELGLGTLQATSALRPDYEPRIRSLETDRDEASQIVNPEIRIRSLETDRDQIRGALSALRILVAISSLISAVVGIVEALRILHP